MVSRPSKRLFVVLITVLLGTGVCVGGLNQNSGKVLAAAQPEAGKVIEASKDYLAPGKSKRMMMMDLGATTCIPCKMMAPVMEELAKEFKDKLDVQFVDVNKRGDLAEKYKIYVIPTQIFFDKNGKELFRHLGFYPKAEILVKLKELGLRKSSTMIKRGAESYQTSRVFLANTVIEASSPDMAELIGMLYPSR
jgi:thioredoxin 1